METINICVKGLILCSGTCLSTLLICRALKNGLEYNLFTRGSIDQYLRMWVLDSNLNQTTYLLRDCVLVTQYLCIMFTYLQNTMNNTTYLTEFLWGINYRIHIKCLGKLRLQNILLLFFPTCSQNSAVSGESKQIIRLCFLVSAVMNFLGL